jgi:phosphoribosylanthranilate isomerase
MTLIKICGITTVEHGLVAARAGADLIGLVFVKKSPRYISPEEANDLVTEVKHTFYDEGLDPPHFVGLFVDAGEKELAEAAPFLSHFQLHGHEDPARVAELGLEFGLDVIKAVGVAEAADLVALGEMASAADLLLFDAKPDKGAVLPGGNGQSFDWSILSNYSGETPFLVAGGLTPDNVADAIKAAKGHTAYGGVDVSSGVESAPGKKDAALIEAFVKNAKAAIG